MNKNLFWKKLFIQTRFEFVNSIRNGEQLLISALIPIGTFVFLQNLNNRNAVTLAVSLSIIGSSFTGQAIAIAYDRRYGAAKAFALMPIGKSGYILAKGISASLISFAITALLVAISVLLNLQQNISFLLIPNILLLSLLSTSAAALIASVFRAEAVLALSNLIFISLGATAGYTNSNPQSIFKYVDLLGLFNSAAQGQLTATLTIAIAAALLIRVTSRRFKWE